MMQLLTVLFHDAQDVFTFRHPNRDPVVDNTRCAQLPLLGGSAA